MRRHVRTFAKHQAVFIGHAVIRVHIGVGVLHFGYVADGHRTRFAGVIVPFAPFRRNKVRLVKGVVLRHGIERHRRRINRALRHHHNGACLGAYGHKRNQRHTCNHLF